MRTLTKRDFPLWFKMLTPIVVVCISLMIYSAKDRNCSLHVDAPQTKVKRQWNDCIEVCTDSEHSCRRACWNSDATCRAKCIMEQNSCMSLCDQTWRPRYEAVTPAPSSSGQ
jgi:hypothetical protein